MLHSRPAESRIDPARARFGAGLLAVGGLALAVVEGLESGPAAGLFHLLHLYGWLALFLEGLLAIRAGRWRLSIAAFGAWLAWDWGWAYAVPSVSRYSDVFWAGGPVPGLGALLTILVAAGWLWNRTADPRRR